MSEDSKTSPSWVVLEFLAAFAEDQRLGRTSDLATYVERFPGDPDGVAAEYQRFLDSRDHSPAPGQTPGSLPPGLSIRYEFLQELGRGAQGQVSLALDRQLQRKVAIKTILLPPGELGRNARRRLDREARTIAGLAHPVICPIHEIILEGSSASLVMGYVPGSTLAKGLTFSRNSGSAQSEEDAGDPAFRLVRRDARSLDRIRRIVTYFEGVARGLEVAHAANLIHRDIKPGNLMVTPDQEPVILDFGLARESGQDDELLTRTGEALGTPAYMSPEQVGGQSRELDARTDVYSLGVALYETLTGTRPFVAKTRVELEQAILTQEPVDPKRHVAAMPSELCAILKVCLDKDRERRYASAGPLAEDLRRFLDFEPVMARPPGSLLRVRRTYQRHPVSAWSLTALGMALLGGLVLTTLLLVRARDAEATLAKQVVILRKDAAELRHLVEFASLSPSQSRAFEVPAAREALARAVALENMPDCDSSLTLERARAQKLLGTLLIRVSPEERSEGAKLLIKAAETFAGFTDEVGLDGQATCLREVAFVAINDGRTQEAVETARKGLQHLARGQAQAVTPAVEDARKSAEMLLQETLGAALLLLGEKEDGRKALERAIEIAYQRLARTPSHAKRIEHAITMKQRLLAHRFKMEDYQGVDEEAGELIALGTKLVAETPGRAESWFTLANPWILRSNLAIKRRSIDDAAAAIAPAVSALTLAVRAAPGDPNYRPRLISALEQQIRVLNAQRKKSESESARRELSAVRALHQNGKAAACLEAAAMFLDSTVVPAAPDRAMELIESARKRPDAAECEDLLAALWVESLYVARLRSQAKAAFDGLRRPEANDESENARRYRRLESLLAEAR